MNDQTNTESTVKKFVCPKCGAILEEGVAACSGCGVRFSYKTSSAMQSSAKRSVEMPFRHWYDILPRVIIIVSSILMFISVFLPYISSSRVVRSLMYTYAKELGESIEYLMNFSLLKCVKLSLEFGGSGEFLFFMIMVMLLSLTILVLGIFTSKMRWRIVLPVCNLGQLIVFCITNHTYNDLREAGYVWSVAFYFLLFGIIFTFLCAGWQIFCETKYGEDFLKNLSKKEVQSNGEQTSNEIDRIKKSPINSYSDVQNHEAVALTETIQTTKEDDLILTIKKYKHLMDEGYITDEDYNAKKKQLLGI